MTKRLCMAVTVAVMACSEDPAITQQRQAIELYKEGKWEEAATTYEEVIRLNPNIDERVRKKTANAWAKAGQYDKAEATLIAFAERKTGADKLQAYRDIAAMWLQQGHDIKKGEEWFKKALELDPNDEQTMGWMAELAAVQGGARSAAAEPRPEYLDQALGWYEKLIARNPEGIGPYVNTRIVYAKYIPWLQKQGEQALADAEANKKDKEAFADFTKQAEEFQAREKAMREKYEAIDAKVKDMVRAAKAAALDGGVVEKGPEGTDAGSTDAGSAGTDGGVLAPGSGTGADGGAAAATSSAADAG